MSQIDLWGNPVADDPGPIAPYREVEATDQDTLGCASCRHCGCDASRDAKGKYREDWHCKLTKTAIDPDFGTCGRQEQ